MWPLPDCCSAKVLAHLSLAELAVVARVNRYLHEVMLTSTFLELLFERDLHLPSSFTLQETFTIPAAAQFSLLKAVYTSKATCINYLGYATTGGLDDDDPYFWLRRVFKSDSRGYCTRVQAANVTLSGVLAISQDFKPSDQLLQSVRERLEIAATRMGSQGERLRQITNRQQTLERLGVVMIDDLYGNFPGALELPGETPDQTAVEVQEILRSTSHRSIDAEKLRKRADNPWILEEPILKVDFPAFPQIAFLRKLKVSRRGSYTCPVKTLLVLSSLCFTDIEDDVFRTYDGLGDLAEVRKLGIRVIEESEEYTYCELKCRGEMGVQPLLWVQFAANSEVDELVVDLEQRFPSLYLYLHLIDAEDRRTQQQWEHDMTNIDIRCVVPKGVEVLIETVRSYLAAAIWLKGQKTRTTTCSKQC